MDRVKVLLRNPSREVELRGPMSVEALLNRFSFKREAVLVVCNGTLVPGDAVLDDGDSVELRPVISGGALEPTVVSRPVTPPAPDGGVSR
jgi:sulfur carrier protein